MTGTMVPDDYTRVRLVIELCDLGFSYNDPFYYTRIDETLAECEQTEPVQAARRLAAAGPTLLSKRFAFPHIKTAAMDILETLVG